MLLKILRILPLLLVFSLGNSYAAPKPTSTLPVNEFAITDSMRAEIRYVVRAMENLHYNKEKTKDVDFNKFINSFIDNLDLNHLFFTQPEIDQIHLRFDNQLLSYLQDGSPHPAFEIFKAYRENVRDRVEWILKRLEKPFPLNDQATYAPDRKELPFPANPVMANTLWDNRVKYEVINELISDPVNEKGEKLAKEEVKSEQEKLKEAKDNIRKRYERVLKTINEFDSNEVVELFLTSYTQFHDPHSSFFSADSLEDFEMSIHSSLVGIGAMLSIEDGYCTIKELIAGGPAEKSKQLKPGDVILGVAQGDGDFVDIVGLKLRKAIRLIRGEQGTPIRLLIRPTDGDPSARKSVKLVRDEIKITQNLAQAKFYEIKNQGKDFRIGMIEIPSFYVSEDDDPKAPSTTRDVSELIEKLKKLGVEGIILDLRRNGGGFLSEAISLTGLFIPVGPVVQVKDSYGQVREYLDMTTDITWDGPLMLLVSRYSASASEIFAGALKSYKRALIIGDERTHGKGTVQQVMPVEPPLMAKILNSKQRLGAVKITIQKWYLPDGNSTQVKGVESDITIPSINKFLPISESDLDNPMPWDSIKSVPWTQTYLDDYTDTITPNTLKAILAKSKTRQETLPEFKILNENIQLFENKWDQKDFSLNLAFRENQRKADNLVNEKIKEEIKEIKKQTYEGTEIQLESVKKQEGTDASTAKKEGAEDLEESDDDDGIPAFDIDERESLRIMADYLALKESLKYPTTDIAHNGEPLNQTIKP